MIVSENRVYSGEGFEVIKRVSNIINDYSTINYYVKLYDVRLPRLDFRVRKRLEFDIKESEFTLYMEKFSKSIYPFIDILNTYGNIEDIFLPLIDCGYIVLGINFDPSISDTITITFNNNITSKYSLEYEHFKSSLSVFGLNVTKIYGSRLMLSYE